MPATDADHDRTSDATAAGEPLTMPPTLPPEKKGSTERYPRGRWATAPDSLVGVDIGNSEVRVAVMRPADSASERLHWTDYHRFPLHVESIETMLARDVDEVFDTLHHRVPRSIEGENNVAAVSLPVQWTRYQTVKGNEIDETRLQNDQRFTMSVFQSRAQLSHWPVVGTHHGTPRGEDHYVTCAVPQRIACAVADLLSASGYSVESILPRGVALVHASESLTGVDAQCVLWLGLSSSLVAVRHRSGVGLVRTLPPPPPSITQSSEDGRPLDAFTLRPHLSKLAGALQATIAYAARADMSDVSQQPILLAGPLAEVPGVAETFAMIVQLPVAPWAFLGRSRPTPPASHRDAETIRRGDARYATALSLAWAAARTSANGYAP